MPSWEYRHPGLDPVTCAPIALVNHRRVAAGRAIRDLLAALGMPPADHAGRADGFAGLVEALDAPATRAALAALCGVAE